MIKVDRMCMAHGLETLSPFLDIKLASIVNTLPGSYKICVQIDLRAVAQEISRLVYEFKAKRRKLKAQNSKLKD
ncbi:MAG: hypothetical protein DRG35_05335 [Deltaproteobacteria bacterium]|nr:MAG: hypothetical protein DRG35_05335 [Deltaproteobacteria bacterium]